MTEVGKIEMRMPNGRKSFIQVSLAEKGQIDIVVSRSSEGEALIRLPRETAHTLSHLLAMAYYALEKAAATPSPSDADGGGR